MLRGLGGPRAEAVVVLGRIDHALHAAFLEGFHDLGGIEVRGVENLRVFVSVSPFPAGKGVQAEVDETVEFHALPVHLLGRRHGAERFGRVCGLSGQHQGGKSGSNKEGRKLVHEEYMCYRNMQNAPSFFHRGTLLSS